MVTRSQNGDSPRHGPPHPDLIRPQPRWWWLGVWWLLVWHLPGIALAGVEARVNQTTLTEGESVELTLEGNSTHPPQPDLAPLNQDFQVLGSSQGQQWSMVGGQTTARSSLTITLLPKRGGQVTIPPLNVGGDFTPPIPLQVIPAGAQRSDGDREYRLEVALTPSTTWVQAQALLTIRLYHSGTLQDGAITLPTSTAWVVESLGEDRQGTESVQGKRYQILERRYALFPQTHGQLTLEGIQFQGRERVRSNQRRPDALGLLGRDLFQMLQETRPVLLSSAPVTITVQPQSPTFTGSWWLPASQLTLSESWSGEPSQLKAGEPVTRTVIINAKGLLATALPELTPPQVAGLKSYPDQPSTRSQAVGDWILGERVEKWAFIPTQAGEFTLPALEIPWWNTTTNQPGLASLPSRTLTVVAPPGKPVVATPPLVVAPPLPEVAVAPPPSEESPRPVPSAGEPQETTSGYWPWVSLLLLAGWVITLYQWKVLPRRQPFFREKPVGPQQLRRQVERHCRANDPSQTRQAILQWARVAWPDSPPSHLQEVGERIQDPRGRSLLEALERRLYTEPRDPVWDGPGFWADLQPLLVVSVLPSAPPPGLPPLHPS